MAKYTMGIDCGTGGLRVGIFDTSGKTVIFCSQPVKLYTPLPGYAEQDPREWWDALCAASKRAFKESGVQPQDIAGVSCSATASTVLFLGKDMRPLRPALMWCDVRASAQAARIAQTGDPALKYNGFGNVSAEWTMPKILWVKENEPQVYEKAAHICECLDFLNYKLTGELATSMNIATIRWHYDNRNGGWPMAFYGKIGLGDADAKFPQSVVPLGQLMGKISAQAARETGIAEGTPVGMGGCDAYLGTLGLNVVRPGLLFMGMGSSHLQYMIVDEPFYDKGLFGAYPDAVIPGTYAVEAGQASTGSVVKWFEGGYAGGLANEAEQKGCSVLELLNVQAAKLPPGAENLIMLDYFQGNRTPYVDSDARGMIYGLTLKHTPAHIYRAVIESVCYGTEQIIETLSKYTGRPKAIYACGGPVKSALWLQIHADVSNMPVWVAECTEGPCLGAAIIGAVVGDVYGTLVEASDAMVHFARCVQPSRENHEAYQFFVRKHQEIYPLAKDWMHEVTRHNSKTN